MRSPRRSEYGPIHILCLKNIVVMIKACKDSLMMTVENEALADQPLIKELMDQLENTLELTYGDISQ